MAPFVTSVSAPGRKLVKQRWTQRKKTLRRGIRANAAFPVYTGQNFKHLQYSDRQNHEQILPQSLFCDTMEQTIAQYETINVFISSFEIYRTALLQCNIVCVCEIVRAENTRSNRLRSPLQRDLRAQTEPFT